MQVQQTVYSELKRICSVCMLLTEDAARTLVIAYVLSLLDYCNYLLMGIPISAIQPLQKIQNFAARLVHGTTQPPRHNSPVKNNNNCIGVPYQNVLSIKWLVCISTLQTVPVLLTSLKLVHIYTSSRTLRSSSDTRMLKIQQCKRDSQFTHLLLDMRHMLLLETDTRTTCFTGGVYVPCIYAHAM